MSQVSSVQFTVGKIDAGMAILLSPDHRLPDGSKQGNIVNITVERNFEEEQRQADQFASLQDEIYHMFSKIPEAPHIAMKWVTQTTIILKWEPLNIYAATFRGLDVYRNEQKLGLNLQHTATGCKLSGLDVNQEYDICVVVRTSAGNFTSNKITIRTLELENLTGLYPAFGSFANDADIDTLSKLLERIGAQYSDDLTSDNTHLICTLPKGPKYEKALELNIPIVTPEFLKACEQQGKVQPAHIYYSK